MENPIDLFAHWYQEELVRSNASIPSACCLSTIGLDGYPNARYVSLKAVERGTFLITGPMDARKGLETTGHPKVAITFWWTETERQVRIQGDAVRLSEAEAKQFFAQRNRAAKIVSSVFEQGKPIDSLAELTHRYALGVKEQGDNPVHKPNHWSGLAIHPKRMEFMAFQPTRLHQRTLFLAAAEGWEKSYLQP